MERPTIKQYLYFEGSSTLHCLLGLEITGLQWKHFKHQASCIFVFVEEKDWVNFLSQYPYLCSGHFLSHLSLAIKSHPFFRIQFSPPSSRSFFNYLRPLSTPFWIYHSCSIIFCCTKYLVILHSSISWLKKKKEINKRNASRGRANRFYFISFLLVFPGNPILWKL